MFYDDKPDTTQKSIHNMHSTYLDHFIFIH